MDVANKLKSAVISEGSISCKDTFFTKNLFGSHGFMYVFSVLGQIYLAKILKSFNLMHKQDWSCYCRYT